MKEFGSVEAILCELPESSPVVSGWGAAGPTGLIRFPTMSLLDSTISPPSLNKLVDRAGCSRFSLLKGLIMGEVAFADKLVEDDAGILSPNMFDVVGADVKLLKILLTFGV